MLLVRKLMSPDKETNGGEGDQKPASQQSNDQKPAQPSVVELAKALKEARENSVPKEEYEKVVQEKNELVQNIINGGASDIGQNSTKQKADIKALREELYGSKGADLSNLAYWEKTLELREAVMEQEGYDPFLPHGSKIKPTEQDIEKAELVAKTVKECIDKADGSSEVFTALLQGETANDSPSFLAHLKKIGVKI